MSGWVVLNGDCLEVLAQLEANSVDAVVTDPPAGIGFMGKAWDRFGKGGMRAETIAAQKASEKRNEPFGRSGKPAKPAAGERDNFVAFMTAVMEEVHRVLKPGGHILVWGIPRTCHWTAWAIESAGFEIRDTLCHLFGQGFPKSLNIAKAIQKESGVKPVCSKPASLGMKNNPQWNALKNQLVMPPTEGAAAEWDGFGTALKPGREDWILARKPISEKTVAKNVLKWGVGGINIDGCRIKHDPRTAGTHPTLAAHESKAGTMAKEARVALEQAGESAGRFPANVVLSHHDDCVQTGTREVKTGIAVRRNGGGGDIFGGSGRPKLAGPAPDHTHGKDGKEEIEAWDCHSECPVKILDEQSGIAKPKPSRTAKRGGSPIFGSPTIGTPDKEGTWPEDAGGGASRFFYVAKPARSEKEAGCTALPKKGAAELTGRKEGSAGLVAKHKDGSDKANPYAGTSGAEPRANHHPTVKSVALMRYLVRLVTPPGGTVLDPFCGSGSTGIAAIYEGADFIGIEKDPDYVQIAEARIEHATQQGIQPA